MPPIVFIRGASASLYDPTLLSRNRLEGRPKLLFVDRPGHGQADAIATLMDQRHIGPAIVVGHSFGGAIAASLASGIRER